MNSSNEDFYAAVNFFGVALNISLNMILIPKYGYFGAGISTIITEIFLCFTLYAVVSRFLKINVWRTIFGLLPGSAILMAAPLLFRSIPWLPVIGAAALLYVFLAYLTKIITKDDLSVLSGLVSKKASPVFWEDP